MSSTPTPQSSPQAPDVRRNIASVIRANDEVLFVVSFDAIADRPNETTPKALIPQAVETLKGLASLEGVKVVVFADDHHLDVRPAFEGLKDLDGLEVRTSHGRQVRHLDGGLLSVPVRFSEVADVEHSTQMLVKNELELKQIVNQATSGHLKVVLDGPVARVVPREENLVKKHEIVFSAYRFLDEANGKNRFKDASNIPKNIDLEAFFDHITVIPFDSGDGIHALLRDHPEAAIVYVAANDEYDRSQEALATAADADRRIAVVSANSVDIVREFEGVVKTSRVTQLLQDEGPSLEQGRSLSQS